MDWEAAAPGQHLPAPGPATAVVGGPRAPAARGAEAEAEEGLAYGSGAPRRAPLAFSAPSRPTSRPPTASASASASRLLALSQQAQGPADGVRMSNGHGRHASPSPGANGVGGRGGRGARGSARQDSPGAPRPVAVAVAEEGGPAEAEGGDDEAHILRQLFDGQGVRTGR
jgi:hypothetical protein